MINERGIECPGFRFGVCVVDQHGFPVLLEADRVPVPVPAIRLDNGDRRPNGLGRYVCKARQGDAMLGKAQLPANSMQLTVAVAVTATGATAAILTWPTNGERGDGLSKAWLWWVGKGVTGWRRTIADAAFASTKWCVEKDWTDGQADRKTDRRIERQSRRSSAISFNIAVVDAVGAGAVSLFGLVSQVWGVLVWRRRGVPRTRSPHCSLRAGQWNPRLRASE